MTRISKHLVLATAAVAAFALSLAEPAKACTCPAPSLEESFEAAAVAFEGTVLELEPREAATVRPLSIVYRVERYWKGEPEATIQVHSGYGDSDCGRSLDLGDTKLVLARDHEGQLVDSLCYYGAGSENWPYRLSETIEPQLIEPDALEPPASGEEAQQPEGEPAGDESTDTLGSAPEDDADEDDADTDASSDEASDDASDDVKAHPDVAGEDGVRRRGVDDAPAGDGGCALGVAQRATPWASLLFLLVGVSGFRFRQYRMHR